MIGVLHDQHGAALDFPEGVEQALQAGDRLGGVGGTSEFLPGCRLEVGEHPCREDMTARDAEPDAKLARAGGRPSRRLGAFQGLAFVSREGGRWQVTDRCDRVSHEGNGVGRFDSDDGDAERHKPFVEAVGDGGDETRFPRSDASDDAHDTFGAFDAASKRLVDVGGAEIGVGDVFVGEELETTVARERETIVESQEDVAHQRATSVSS